MFEIIPFGFLQTAQKPFVRIDFFCGKSQGVERILIVVSDIKFMVGKFGKKHLINIPVAGLVCGDSRFVLPIQESISRLVFAPNNLRKA